MMQTLLLEEGSLVRVKSTSLPLGTFVKLQPQSPDFLEITDPKAVLEKAIGNFSALTQGDIISIKYNNRTYDILIMEAKPGGKGISVVETDLEVDFAAPLGYVEPERSHHGSSTSIEEHTVKDPESFSAFRGSGQRLNGKAKPTAASSEPTPMETSSDEKKIPAVLQLPPGKLYFGYPLVPVKKGDGAEKDKDANQVVFTGTGQTLRAARKNANNASSSSSSSSRKP
ncbi:ubiquitin fusion degradation protein [Chytridiales sp. JEL 0842]|nr:ubiquitin fusion degradation protein [Chytridiales sp. JEL 0842]